jgi:L-ascorbate metabolism protein UlaG (beta-lactamase superfamily)
MAHLRLRDDIKLDVAYDDRSRFGGAPGVRIEREIARVTRDFKQRLEALSPEQFRERHGALLEELYSPSLLGQLYVRPGQLHAEVLYPSTSAIRPAALALSGAASGLISLPPQLLGELASWIAAFSVGCPRPHQPHARALHSELERLGCLTEAPPRTLPRKRGATFVGHATVLITGADGSLLVDPYLLPRSSSYPATYQPLCVSELGPDAVLITHSHPDHFDPGSLLRLGAEVPIFVPAVERESLLAVDMVRRLEELGFREVTAVPCDARFEIAGLRVTARQFYGEQPTQRAQLHEEVTNVGRVYRVDDGQRSYALIADAGSDRRGDMVSEALRDREEQGSIDVLFAGYRSWSLYPAHYLFTSVSRYALFVPPAQRLLRQTIMNDADALLDTAEAWGARHVVPYADGGAPWYWESGLGPRLDGSRGENTFFDPVPEHVCKVARARSSLPGIGSVRAPADVRIVRPGQSLKCSDDGLELSSDAGQNWPFEPPFSEIGLDLSTNMSNGEMVALARKKVLLRILARPELERLGIEPDAERTQSLLDDMRREYGLESRSELCAWLQKVELAPDELTSLLCEWSSIIALEHHYREEIDTLVGAQLRFGTMREWPRIR